MRRSGDRNTAAQPDVLSVTLEPTYKPRAEAEAHTSRPNLLQAEGRHRQWTFLEHLKDTIQCRGTETDLVSNKVGGKANS